MNWNQVKYILRLCKVQLIMLLAGIVLTFWPGSAVVFVTKAAAWILIVTGIYNIVKAASQRRDTAFWIRTVLFLGLGAFILANPLTVSRLLGRIVAVLLVIQGVKDLRTHHVRILGISTLVGGIALFLLPGTLTAALLTLLGVVLIAVGGIHLVEKLFLARKLEEGDDPNIIDAAP